MPEGIKTQKRSAVFTDLGLMAYDRALAFQQEAVRKRISEIVQQDRLLFVEHPPVFTLGKRGGESDLMVAKAFLATRNIRVFQTDRGGKITYHGPGQAVLYPIVHLEQNKIAVKDFVWGLEEIMIRTARRFGVTAERSDVNHGIWVGDQKLGSVGISIKRGVSFHGLALNVMPDLTPFSWINPCGLSQVAMTSVQKELAGKAEPDAISMDRVKTEYKTHFSSVFDYEVVS